MGSCGVFERFRGLTRGFWAEFEVLFSKAESMACGKQFDRQESEFRCVMTNERKSLGSTDVQHFDIGQGFSGE